MSIPLGLVPNQSAALAKLVPRAYFKTTRDTQHFATARTGRLLRWRCPKPGVALRMFLVLPHSTYRTYRLALIARYIPRCLLILTEPIPQAIGNRITSALVVGELDTTRAHLPL